MIYGDFETRSIIDLIKLGATRYAMDPSTQVLCLCWSFDDDPDVFLWHRAHQEPDHPEWCQKTRRPDELIERIRDGEPFEAHNAGFEFAIWNNVLTREFPEFDVKLKLEQMRCSAAKASCVSLPRALGDALKAVNAPTEFHKLADGRRLINKLSKPRFKRVQMDDDAWTTWVRYELAKLYDEGEDYDLESIYRWSGAASKANNVSIRRMHQRFFLEAGISETITPGVYRWTDLPPVGEDYTREDDGLPEPPPGVEKTPYWCEEEIEHRRNWEYCAQDVRGERWLSKWCPEMTERELEYWRMDQRMNQRGVKLDTAGVDAANELVKQEVRRLNAEMLRITEGAVSGGGKRIAWRNWANKQLVELKGDYLADTKADTLSFALYGVPVKAGDQAREAAKPAQDEKWAMWGDGALPLKRSMEICLEVNKPSVSKFKQMAASVCPDGRLHDIMLYNGADRPVTGDAEVLTREGWRKIEDWTGGEIAQWSHVKGTPGRITFGRADRVAFNYPGEMVRMRGPSTELVCTVDHKIPLISCRDNLTDYAASELHTMNWALPLAGILEAPKFESELVTRAIVMTQADGALIYDKDRLDCVRFGFVKARKIKRARYLLTQLGISFSEHRENTGNRATRFRIAARHAPSWMIEAKVFGPGLMKHNPVVLIDELKFWDGCTDKRNLRPGTSYSTCSKNNAEWVATMAALAGTRAHIENRGKRKSGWNDSYRVHIHRSGARSWLKKGWTFRREASPGKVYCARTQTGYFLVRYRGTIQITGNTGRWSGKGVQPHNFVRGYMGEMPHIWCELLNGDPDFEFIEALTGGDKALHVLAKACRGALVASDGYELYAADFNAIEARKLAWMSGCLAMLKSFYPGAGTDLYCQMASAIYRREITKKDKSERNLGKKAILGLGYAMGWEKFQATVWMDEGIWLPDEFCQDVVKIYRKEMYPEVPALWKAANEAAINAVTDGGEWTCGGDEMGIGSITYFVEGPFLHCRLPSGRLLAYLYPEVHSRITWTFKATNERGTPTTVRFPAKPGVAFNRVRYHAEKLAEKQRKCLTNDPPENFAQPHLSFMGRNIVTKKWQRCGTHGGTLVENADQASSRDLLAEAMYRVDQRDPFRLLLSIHDEVIAEAPIGTCEVKEFEDIMAEVPIWAPGMPIAAEGWIGPRLRK